MNATHHGAQSVPVWEAIRVFEAETPRLHHPVLDVEQASSAGKIVQ